MALMSPSQTLYMQFGTRRVTCSCYFTTYAQYAQYAQLKQKAAFKVYVSFRH
jgi:hypothetical protein